MLFTTINKKKNQYLPAICIACFYSLFFSFFIVISASWYFTMVLIWNSWMTVDGLPQWLSGKESACQRWRRGFDHWVRKIPWRSKWQPTPVVLPGESHGQRSLACYSPWGHKELDTTWWINNNSRYWAFFLILTCHPYKILAKLSVHIFYLFLNQVYFLIVCFKKWKWKLLSRVLLFATV